MIFNNMTPVTDPDLAGVLDAADAEDIGNVIDYLTDKGNGRISLSSKTCNRLVAAKSSGDFDPGVRALVAEELQRFGGNSLANLLRGGSGVPYKEIACDVADHMKVAYNSSTDCAQIEVSILAKVLEHSLEKMTEEEKGLLFKQFGANYNAGLGPAISASLIAAIRAAGLGNLTLAAIVTNAVTTALLGRGVTLGAQAGVMRGIGAFAGPIGWAVTAIWTAFDLASPAYRVTVPCVIQIAYMRQKLIYSLCSKCRTPLSSNAKFCSECGSPAGPAATPPALP